MNKDDLHINVIEFFATVQAGNPTQTLKVKIVRSGRSYVGTILEHTNNKGNMIENISSPNVTNKNPTQLLIDLVSKYLTDYEASIRKPVFTIVK